MNIDIRKSIINNFKNNSKNDIKEAIISSMNENDEITLPGLGVFFEILWKNSDEEHQDYILNIIEEKEEFKQEELMQYELDMFGFYITTHPITKYKIKYNNLSINEIENEINKDVELVLLVNKVKENTTKKNEKMCFINAMDEVSNIDLVLFPKVYEKNQNINRLDVIHLFGRVEKRFDKVQIIVNKMEILKGD